MTGLATVLRCSSLSGYADCPRRTAARLFRKEITDAGFRLRYTARTIGGIVGTAIHRAAEVCFADKAKTGELPSEQVATDVAIANLDAGIMAAGEIEFDSVRGATHSRREAEAQTLRMTRTYWRRIAPTVHPIQVEQRLEAEIAPGLILSGTPDIVCREPNAIRDLKTGARMGSHAPQLGGYSLLARTHGVEIAEAAIDWLPRVPTTKPQPEPESVKVPVAQAETAAASIIAHVRMNLEMFRRGDMDRHMLPGDPWAFPANPSSVLCSPKWCPAFGTEFCREGVER